MEDGGWRIEEGNSRSFRTPSSILHPPSSSARLLVSVRDRSEALAALAGGADIIDVKEPSRGSLGMADRETIGDVLRAVAEVTGGNIPVSAALGEARDWLDEEQPLGPTTGRCLHCPPAGLNYAKLGLAALGRNADWNAAWCNLRRRLERADSGTVSWIAVAYVDWEPVEAPPPGEVIDAAAASRCAGVLFDTYCKGGRALFDWIDPPELTRVIDAVHASGMTAAVAGGLNRQHVDGLLRAGADILAIRTAACEDAQRNGRVSEPAVRRFRAAIDAARASADTPPKPDLRPAG